MQLAADPPLEVKTSVVGYGRAGKKLASEADGHVPVGPAWSHRVRRCMRRPAVAICHATHESTARRWRNPYEVASDSDPGGALFAGDVPARIGIRSHFIRVAPASGR